MQDGELLAHDPADDEQRLGDRGQPRKVRDEFADPRLVSTATDDAHFQTEIAQRAAPVAGNNPRRQASGRWRGLTNAIVWRREGRTRPGAGAVLTKDILFGMNILTLVGFVVMGLTLTLNRMGQAGRA